MHGRSGRICRFLPVLNSGWKYHPALKHAITFASGILLARILGLHYDVLLPGLVGSFLWLAAAIRDERFFLPAPIFFVILFSGALTYQSHNTFSLNVLEGLNIRSVEMIGVVVSDPIERNGRFEWSVRSDSILYRNSAIYPVGELRVLLYDSTASLSSLPAYGDQISVRGTLQTSAKPRFPGEPDYRSFYAAQGVEGSIFCSRKSEVFIFGSKELGMLERAVQTLRRYVNRFVQEYIGGKEGGIARALLSGERQDVDRTTQEAFVRTGTAHVLAVSGLHVGIVALALFVFVSWLRNRWLRLVCFLFSLAGYVLLTGGRPSITRAALMGVLFVLVVNLGRISRPLNTLGVAGLLLLMFNPASLFNLGFQLSFAAVAGILLIYPRLYSAFASRFPRSFNNIVVQRTAQLLLLSTSAQLATLPLTLHYFGFVSLIAPVVNIVVVPLVAVGLGAGVLGLMFSTFPFLPEWFGATAYLAIRLVRYLVEWSAGFEFAGLSLPPIGLVETVLLGAGVLYLAFSRSFVQGSLRLFSFAVLLVVAFAVNRSLDPLGRSESGYVYVLPISQAGGLATALHFNDTLSVYFSPVEQRDSHAVARSGDLLAKRIGAGYLQVMNLHADSMLSVLHPNQVLLMNKAGPEYLLTRMPVLLSNTGRRSPGVVLLEGAEVVQVPMQRKIEEGIVLDPFPEWRIVQWR